MTLSWNDRHPFGSANFASHADLHATGMLQQTGTSLFLGYHAGQPLWYDRPGGLLLIGGARSGKLRDVLAYNLCSGIFTRGSMLALDLKGELAAISQDQTPDNKHCHYWNPLGLHGIAQDRVNPVDYLRKSSPSLFADVKLFAEGLVPSSGAPQSAFFEQRAREYIEAISLTLVMLNGQLDLPSLYETINLIPGNTPAWRDFAYEMYRSGIPLVARVEEEIATSREDSSGGYRGIMGELFNAVACLSDPVLRESVSPPFDFSLEDLCRSDQFSQFYMMCPAELVGAYAPVIKAIFTGAMIYKARKPDAPAQTWILDECAQLKGFSLVPRMFTYGAGMGIRPWAVFQSLKQMDDLAPGARDIVTSSAGCQSYFSLRDVLSSRTISEMLGVQTFQWTDPVRQGRARLDQARLLGNLFSGADPFDLIPQLMQKRLESQWQTRQRRPLRTTDEVLNLPENRQFIFADGLPGAVLAERAPYFDQPFMAGRYHPNPYHPPYDRVSVTTNTGRKEMRPVIRQAVPDRFAHLPQYRGGTWSHIGGQRDA
ncbi:type IV secretory system conjugative DNA transfer family protein [Marinibacterium profundimaris]|nr:type IV secretory system conjugative DNA transfer family protein [Marinibacterium profundimaris]